MIRSLIGRTAAGAALRDTGGRVALLVIGVLVLVAPTTAAASTVVASHTDGSTLVAEPTSTIAESDCGEIFYTNGYYDECQEPVFGEGASWTQPVTAQNGQGNGAYYRIPGSDWLGEFTNGVVLDSHWTQFKTTFDRPAGGASLGVRVLVDNAVTGIFVNGHQLETCTRQVPCTGFRQAPYAVVIPDSYLKETGNELRVTVLDFENFVSSGGLDFDVVTRGPMVANKAVDVSNTAGSTLTTSGSFQESFEADANTSIKITADNTVGTFVDHGDGTWTWTYPSTTPVSATSIHVTATDANGRSATDSFNYTVVTGPEVTLQDASCISVANGYAQPYAAVVNNLGNASNGFYLATDGAPSDPWNPWGNLYEYGYAFANGSVYVDIPYYPLPTGAKSVWVDVRPWTNTNTVAASLQVPVCNSDTTPPSVSVSHAVDGQNGWNVNAPVTETVTASDEGSGLAGAPSCTVDGNAVTLSSDGTGAWKFDVAGDGQHAVACSAADNAGNEASAGDATEIDTTPPVVSYSGDAGSYTVADTVDIACSAEDPTPTSGAGLLASGLAGSTCQDISGDAYTFALGQHEVSASATDEAGNEGSGSASFTVTVDSQSLCTLTKRWVSNAGIASSLCAKLSAAQASMQRGDANSKNRQLGAYRNQLSAQSGKSISADKAAILAKLSEAL